MGELKRNFGVCRICVSSMRVEPMKVLRTEIAEYKEVVIRSIEKIKYRFKHVRFTMT